MNKLGENGAKINLKKKKVVNCDLVHTVKKVGNP